MLKEGILLAIVFQCISLISMGQDALLMPSENILRTISLSPQPSSNSFRVTEATLFISQHTGVFSELRSSFASINMRRKRSQISLSFENKNEGPVIKYNNGYINYNIHVPLSEELKASVGLKGGIVSLGLGDSRNADFSSDMDIDMGAAFLLYSSKHFFICRLSHLNRPNLQPSKYRVNYPLGVNALYKHTFSFSNSIKQTVLLDYNRDFSVNILSIGGVATYETIFSMGLMVQSSHDIAIVSRINLYKENDWVLKAQFCYESQQFLKYQHKNIPLLHFGILLKNGKGQEKIKSLLTGRNQ